MSWLKDPAWQQGVAILLVVAGAILTYHNGAGANELSAKAKVGFALFCIGIAVPLLSQLLGLRRESPGKCEDV